jgi:hypothetical protein
MFHVEEAKVWLPHSDVMVDIIQICVVETVPDRPIDWEPGRIEDVLSNRLKGKRKYREDDKETKFDHQVRWCCEVSMFDAHEVTEVDGKLLVAMAWQSSLSRLTIRFLEFRTPDLSGTHEQGMMNVVGDEKRRMNTSRSIS